jgi:hypothetical protein
MLLTIAMLLTFFVSKTFDIVYGYDEMKSKCDYVQVCESNNCSSQRDKQSLQEQTNCYNNIMNLENKYNNDKTIGMIVAGFVLLLAGIYFTQQNGSNTTVMGAGFGGFLLIMYYTVFNWRNIKSIYQMAIVGVVIAILGYIGANGSIKI